MTLSISELFRPYAAEASSAKVENANFIMKFFYAVVTDLLISSKVPMVSGYIMV